MMTGNFYFKNLRDDFLCWDWTWKQLYSADSQSVLRAYFLLNPSLLHSLLNSESDVLHINASNIRRKLLLSRKPRRLSSNLWNAPRRSWWKQGRSTTQSFEAKFKYVSSVLIWQSRNGRRPQNYASTWRAVSLPLQQRSNQTLHHGSYSRCD